VRVFDGGHHHQRGINGRLRSAELRILGRALGGDGPRRGDLFSYLYFDSEFIESSIDLGRQDAEAAFDGVPADVVPWRIGPQQPAVVG
jgi:NTE family protein